MKTLRLLLGDQLNHQHSWYEQNDKQIIYCLFEMRQETDYAPHHIQKVLAFFLAMRAFAKHLEDQGHQVIYYTLDASENTQSLTNNLQQIIEQQGVDKFEYQLPDEYRLDLQLKTFCDSLDIETQVYDTEHFLSSRTDLSEFFEGKKTYLMESFYRHMRKRYDILMDGDQPQTGQWNYDADNRKKIPKDHVPPHPKLFEKEVTGIIELLETSGVKTIGKVNPKAFIWPVTRAESLEQLKFFLEQCLEYFGKFQDAMTPQYWSLYHSRISFSLNAKLLHPLEVIKAAEEYWQDNQNKIDIAQVEGFIRQILGWREYMRGIYWAKMPEYKNKNFLGHTRKLPSWFWTGKTKMRCVSHAIQQSLDYAYAHHIQRLMITGNFALLAGVAPDEVDEWYLGIYIDAIQWVEITNTRGMSQFADGGIVGTKPYVSSANYVNKMSHYCKDCHYSYKDKTGAKACPFNSLYWDFYDRHEDKLAKNPRIGMAYRLWNKMEAEKKEAILKQANHYLSNIEEL